MKENSNNNKVILKKWWFWCILIVVIIVVILVIAFINKNKNISSGDVISSVQSIDEVMLPEFNKTGTASEKVLYDQNNVKITFKGITYSTYSADINLEFENNNSEKLKFISGSAGLCKNSVNEFMIKDAYINTEVDAGQKITDSVSFDYDSLMLYGIDEIAQIILNFDISPSDYSSNFKDIYTDSLVIDTSLFDSYDFNKDSRYLDRITSKAIESKYNSKIVQKDTTKNPIVDKLDIVSMVIMQNKDGNQTMMLETKNDCGKDVKLSISDIKFNDKLIYDYSWSRDDIINGKKGILEMNLSFLANEDEAKDIDMVRTVSFTVGILDSNFQTVASQEITYEINSPIAITSND